MTRSAFALLLLTVTCLAASFRLPRLDTRPMHADEAVQARRFRDLWIDHRYRYDPDEFHGPTLNYATLPSVWWQPPETFAQTTKATYRIVPAIFGVCLILLLFLLADAVGRPAVLAAAVLIAVSPAMVFYSRYYIHETLLVFFSLAAIGASWRYVKTGKLGWCLAAGVCIGLMQATKETAVLAFAAAGAATVLTVLWHRLRREPISITGSVVWWHPVCGLVVALLVAAVLFTSFGANPRGLADAVLTYLPWLSRAGGASPHVYPWYFYFHRLAWWRVADGPRWSEGLILLLAAVGMGFALLGGSQRPSSANLAAVRWVGFYTVVLAGVYTVIPYKTPWCLLQFLIGLILLAGFGASRLLAVTPTVMLKCLLAIALLIGVGHLGWQARRAAFVMPADPRNPYVYAHTAPDIERLAADLDQLIAAASDGRQTPVKVIFHGPYYWPLPWYLRGLERAEYWTHLPDEAQSPIVVSSPQFDRELTERLDDTHLMTGYYSIRPSVLVQLWVRMDVWEAHLRRLGRI
ncbi:MAG: TIGR03663 family protein [Pirellulaceae bacterium]|nr:TIGR03663 family protein [Pirellulaceae bacterium]